MSASLVSASRFYQDAKSPGSGTVSLTTSQRNKRHIFRSALASLCLKTVILLGWNATTKSMPSRLIDTCLRTDRKSFRKDSTVSSADISNPTDWNVLMENHFFRLGNRLNARILEQDCPALCRSRTL
jgi:hypothetical protein